MELIRYGQGIKTTDHGHKDRTDPKRHPRSTGKVKILFPMQRSGGL